jgi:hypothetical protein
MTVAIKLMTDYACHPLWWDGADRVGNIDPSTLPLSKETIERLQRWADVYNATLDWGDPGNSPGFRSHREQELFEREGIEIWKQLQRELSPYFKVSYFSDSHSKTIGDLNELETLICEDLSPVLETTPVNSSSGSPLKDLLVDKGGKIFQLPNKNGDVISINENYVVIAVEQPEIDRARHIPELINV